MQIKRVVYTSDWSHPPGCAPFFFLAIKFMPHTGIALRQFINPAPFSNHHGSAKFVLSLSTNAYGNFMQISIVSAICNEFALWNGSKKPPQAGKFNLPCAVGKSNCINVNLLIQYLSRKFGKLCGFFECRSSISTGATLVELFKWRMKSYAS